MKYSNNANTLFFLLYFTMSQRTMGQRKNIEKQYL